MKYWSHTKKGRKPVNEDILLHQDLSDGRFLCLVADGMGGYSNGAATAKLVADNILALISYQKLVDQRLIQIAINKANLALRQLLQKTGEKSGATLGGVYIDDQKAIAFWIGDVKILHFRNDVLKFESKPHSLVAELQEKGMIIDPTTARQHIHLVTRSIQGEPDNPIADVYKVEHLSITDTFFICSDGYPSGELINSLQAGTLLEMAERIAVKNQNTDDASVICLMF